MQEDWRLDARKFERPITFIHRCWDKVKMLCAYRDCSIVVRGFTWGFPSSTFPIVVCDCGRIFAIVYI